MALSKEEKDALEAHYKGRDLYDPSKEPGQAPPSFSPAMCRGGEMGYAEGGPVMLADGGEIDLGDPMPFETSDYNGPVMSADTDTVKAPISEAPEAPAFQMPAIAPNRVPQAAPRVQAAAPAGRGTAFAPPPASPSPLNAPAASGAVPGGMSSAEFSQLMQYLQPSAGKRFGQASMSALAGLADAIETGVARTQGSNFQKNIAEDRQKQKENLLNALKAKYETGFKGRELGLSEKRAGEEERHNLEGEKETREARKLTQQAQDLLAAQHGSQLGMEKSKLEAEENKTALEHAEKTGGIWNKIKGTVGLGVPGPDPAILSRAQGKTAAPSAGPYGPSVIRGGKTYIWSPVSHQYHPAK